MSKLALFRADQCRKDHCDNNSKKCGDIVLTNSSLKNNISFVTDLLFEGILKGGVKHDLYSGTNKLRQKHLDFSKAFHFQTFY